MSWTRRRGRPPLTATSAPARLAALGLLLPLVLVFAACSEDTDAAAPATPEATAAPAETAVATPAPEETPPPDPTPVVTAYDALTSYRYEVSMLIATDAFGVDDLPDLGLDDMNMELRVQGTRINPDREHAQIVANLGSFISVEVESITIGDQQWTREPGGAWRRTSATLPGGIPGDLDVRPGAIFGHADWDQDEIARLQSLFEAYPYELDELRGIPARHYHFTAEEFAEFFEGSDLFTSDDDALDVSFQLWVSEEHGVPVAMVILGTTAEGVEALRFHLEMFDLDDPSLSVEPPEDV
jgi:hypothetical protein